MHSIRRALDDGIGQLTAPDDERAEAEARVTRVIEELQSLNDGMSSLGTTLGNGIDHLAQSPGGASQLSAEVLEPLLKQLQKSGKREDISAETRRIIVQYRLPKEVVGVLKHQFDLMKGWMLPILNAANLQSSDIQQLQQSLDATLNSYATLVEHLEDLPPKPKS